MPVSLETYLASLASCGLFAAADVESLRRETLAEQLSATDAAQRWVASGRLTSYQAKRLLAGEASGLVLGDYSVLDELGGGGMGRVYKAVHRRMDRIVALKVMSPDRLASAAALKRFHREVRAAARLIHPHIVTAFDAGEHDGIHYLVMEYVEGQDLATVVRENGVLPVVDALECVLQVARGLQFAHSKGVVHRDIKPGNLLLDWAGHVRILDMGLASLDRGLNLGQPAGARPQASAAEEHSHEPGELTQHGQIVGTLDYMAPEQAARDRHLDGRVDIYSLGCTLFQLLAGRPPFSGESTAEKLRAHREGEIPYLTAVRSEVPNEVDVLFCKMVAKRPDQRPANVEQLIGEIESCLAIARSRQVAMVSTSIAGDWSGVPGILEGDSGGDWTPGNTATAANVSPRAEEPTTVGEGHGLTAVVEPPAEMPVVETPVLEKHASTATVAAQAPASEAELDASGPTAPTSLPESSPSPTLLIVGAVVIVALLAVLAIIFYPR